MKIVLLGCPGAGKGTQSKLLCVKYGTEHIATGDIFRSEIEKKSSIGQKAESYVKRGMLVPDELVVEMVASRLDAGSGKWLLDGFPRTLGQAQELDKYLSENKQAIDTVIYLAMKQEDVIERLTGRRTCTGCGEVFHITSRPAQEDDKCDKCGEKLILREDDTKATVEKRMMIFEDLTAPLVAYYRAEHDFIEIDGSRGFKEVTDAIIEHLNKTVVAGKGS